MEIDQDHNANKNCYRLSRVSWTLAQISCFIWNIIWVSFRTRLLFWIIRKYFELRCAVFYFIVAYALDLHQHRP